MQQSDRLFHKKKPTSRQEIGNTAGNTCSIGALLGFEKPGFTNDIEQSLNNPRKAHPLSNPPAKKAVNALCSVAIKVPKVKNFVLLKISLTGVTLKR